MPTDLSSPIRDAIRKAVERKVDPGVASQLEKRFEGASNVIAVVCDCSGSMNDPITSQGVSKYDHLVIALADVLRTFPLIKLVAFNYTARLVTDPEFLPRPMGGTNLAGALEYVGLNWKPRKTIVISDGMPDHEEAALREAEKLTGSIDTIYCGWDGDPAVDFLRRLSRSTGGRAVVWDGKDRELGMGDEIRGMLGPG